MQAQSYRIRRSQIISGEVISFLISIFSDLFDSVIFINFSIISVKLTKITIIISFHLEIKHFGFNRFDIWKILRQYPVNSFQIFSLYFLMAETIFFQFPLFVYFSYNPFNTLNYLIQYLNTLFDYQPHFYILLNINFFQLRIIILTVYKLHRYSQPFINTVKFVVLIYRKVTDLIYLISFTLIIFKFIKQLNHHVKSHTNFLIKLIFKKSIINLLKIIMLKNLKIFFNFSVRVRYAPSPTGMMHLGGLRTALYNYLFAKKNNGKFLLRIQDTDRNRLVKGSKQDIIQTLNWCKIIPDEGPNTQNINHQSYIQSQRLQIYKKYQRILFEQKKIYHCFCSQQRLQKLKKRQKQQGDIEEYDGHCRHLTQQQVQTRLLNKQKFVIRFKVPPKDITFKDQIFGNITIEKNHVDDFILIKSDGWPTYHFANVIDDYQMKITHVIRGQQWITSTPKHIHLYQALGLNIPKFVHLPLIISPNGGKLSKRDKSTSIYYYKQNNYQPEALINSIALMGWTPSNEKIFFSLQELIQQFKLEGLNKSQVKFDAKKLEFFNRHYIKQKYKIKNQSQIQKIEKFRQKLIIQNRNFSNKFIYQLSQLVLPRIRKWADLKQYDYFFKQLDYNNDQTKKDFFNLYSNNLKIQEGKIIFEKNSIYLQNKLILEHIIEIIKIQNLSEQIFANEIKKFVSEHPNLNIDNVYHLIRFCITGRQSGPNIIKIVVMLDKKIAIQRLSLFC